MFSLVLSPWQLKKTAQPFNDTPTAVASIVGQIPATSAHSTYQLEQDHHTHTLSCNSTTANIHQQNFGIPPIITDHYSTQASHHAERPFNLHLYNTNGKFEVGLK